MPASSPAPDPAADEPQDAGRPEGPPRRRGVPTKVVLLALVLLSALYLALLVQQGVRLVLTGEVVAVLLGAGVLLVPLLCGWAVVRELMFGRATERLADELAAVGGLPVDDLQRRPSGRVVRADAERLFSRCRAEVEEDPDDWARWFRLSLAYDASGDRRRARAAVRHAIELHG